VALPVNPIELTDGQSFTSNCRVMALVWTGSTTAGDTCLVQKLGGSTPTVWRARTDSTNTYLGLAPTHYGIHCPDGFSVTVSAGTVLVYLREE
jgi:hypothetical protein